MHEENVFPSRAEDDETTNENQENAKLEGEDQNPDAINMKQRKKKALLEFRCRVEDAILSNYILRKTDGKFSGESKNLKENLKNVALWGVPLLPSKGHEGTDIILLKFLKAKDYKVSEAFNMLRKTLKWRRESNIDGIFEENMGSHLENVMYINGTDNEGHPLYYSIYGAFKERELYERTFGTEENCEEFLRWKVQIMERGIQKLSFKNGGVNSIVHISDLKNSPSLATKELRLVTKKMVMLFQENYPELIFKNIVINVPFWNFLLHVLQSRFITQRTKSKFIFARPSKVTETLLKFIAPEKLPVQYGGLKREDNDEFSSFDKVFELILKGYSIATIQFPVPEDGVTLVWDITVVGYEVIYKEEFVPEDDCSYKVMIQKEKKMGECVRNSFYISEPGNIVITIDNDTYKRKKVFYRYKSKPTVPIYAMLKS